MSVPSPVSHYLARNQGCSKKVGKGRIQTRRKMPLLLRQNYKTVFKIKCVVHTASYILAVLRWKAQGKMQYVESQKVIRNVLMSYRATS